MATGTAFFCLSSKTPVTTLASSNSSRKDGISSPNFLLKKKKKHQQESSSNCNLRYNNSPHISKRFPCISCKSVSISTVDTRNYEFSDGGPEVELRINLRGNEVQDSRDVFVDAEGTSLTIKLQAPGSTMTLLETNHLYGNIKPAETIWCIDEDQLVINLKKHDPDLKWPDIMESWESLTAGAVHILKGSSIYIVGESTEINQTVARELAVGLGYTLLNTTELLEAFGKRSIDSWVIAEGANSVAESEGAILESLSSHIRAVVGTLGGVHGAAANADKWRHLYSGFTIWLSQSETSDEDSAKEEARRQIKDGSRAYSNADVVVKLGGWDPNLAQIAAQACLSALKRLILSDKKLPGKKSLYIRLGCRGDWPNIKPPGWDPSSGGDTYVET